MQIEKIIKSHLAVLFLFLITFVNCSFANHIYGGEFSFKCNDLTSFADSIILEIEYNFFVECFFAEPENLLLIPFWNDLGGQGLNLDFVSKTNVEVFTYDCFNLPSNICIEKWLYSKIITFPIQNNTFYFSMQDCCRSDNLVNLNGDVMDDFAITNLVEIDPGSQVVCNQSPTFFDSPAIFICANEYFQIDQIATDVDDDQLVFELCEVYASDDFNTLSPPPYPPVPLANGYSPLNPLGQNVLNLEVNTGTLSGFPQQIGSYVVGFCVSEYRNGEYLSTIRRDIQVTVVDCEPLVTAVMYADEITLDNIYIINSCNQQTITFENLSTDESNITNQLWSFDMGAFIDTSTQWSPTIYFEEPGSYNGNLILNPNGECTDTLDFIVNVVADIIPDFVASYDTCISGPIQFSNNSLSFGSELATYGWSFGDSTFSSELEPIKIYEDPGMFQVQLQVIDEFGCADSITQQIDWRPAPALIIVSPETAANCAPLTTIFNNLSWPIDTTYSFEWDFGDGAFGFDEINPEHTYLQQGTYDVAISVTSPIGCVADTVFQELVLVEAPPIAAFNYFPTRLTQFDSEFSVSDHSERAVRWHWFFDQVDSSYMQEPTYVFADTGWHTVRLVVEDFYGCADTLLQAVDVVPEVTYFLPNAFTPNGDGMNDVFEAKGYVDGMLNFKLQILDRWGGSLFITDNPNFEWTGYDPNSGNPVNKGVYMYEMMYTTSRGEKIEEHGYVAVVR